ncbi:helix-turn-helix transcriptional regulator [Vibrio parahaemolyticus]
MVYKGYSHKQIAEMLFIAERTVAKHVQNIFEKAQVSNRLELSRKLDMV